MGGVFVAHDATTAQEVQFTALRYVAKKLFIAQVTQFQCVKVILFLIRCITKKAVERSNCNAAMFGMERCCVR